MRFIITGGPDLHIYYLFAFVHVDVVIDIILCTMVDTVEAVGNCHIQKL